MSNPMPPVPESVKGWNWTKRPTVAAAEALIDIRLPVLDRGFVRLVDYIGGDARIVQSARVSYGAGTKTKHEDRGLIDYLMRNAHTSPFEQVSIVLHIKLPLFVFAQLVRHRTAKLNSMSARYSVMADEFYIPEPENVRGQSATNKQVGEGQIATAEQVVDALRTVCEQDYAIYEGWLEQGLSREQARMVLPQNLYTEVYWKCDLHNLFHFLRLRLDGHAQWEIRQYAEAMAKVAQAVAPMAYEAFEEHLLFGARFSRAELAALHTLVYSNDPAARVAALDGLGERRGTEFVAKLMKGAPDGE